MRVIFRLAVMPFCCGTKPRAVCFGALIIGADKNASGAYGAIKMCSLWWVVYAAWTVAILSAAPGVGSWLPFAVAIGYTVIVCKATCGRK